MDESIMTHPTPRLDAREFIEHVVASGLMDREELARALEGLPETDKAKTVARHLMRTGKLTKFQARRLLGGRTEGFILGQYRILEELGRGGMGHVYKAVHQTMGRFVALKILAPQLMQTERARELFQREVRAAGKLHHPNIVTAYDASPIGDQRVFLVMEYVDGPNLSQLVKEQGPLPIEQACEYVRQAAVGLDYAHNQGLIHRDVKPSNLLVQQTSTGPQIKILDFGLALVTAAESGGPEAVVGAANTSLGTPDYTSPEQARDQYGVDRRSDLYSLGCTLFFLLTGEPPFPGGSGIDKLLRQGSEPPPAVRSKRPDIPEAVAEVVHKLLAKNPKWRFQTGGELAAELAIVLGKKAEWTAPTRPTPKPRPKPALEPELDLEPDDEPLTDSSEDDPFDSQDLEEPSASTVPTAAMSTRETPAPRQRPGGRRKQTLPWMWIALAAGLAFFFVALFGLVVRYLLQHVS